MEGPDTPFQLSQRSELSPTTAAATTVPSPSRARFQLLETELAENRRKMVTLQESNQRHQNLVQTLQGQVSGNQRWHYRFISEPGPSLQDFGYSVM